MSPAQGGRVIRRAGRHRGGVRRVVAGDRVQQERGVPDAARERADLVEGGGIRDQAVARHAAVGGLDADHAAVRGRLPDRTAGVRAQRSQAQARGHGGGRAAARAARDPGEVPRVAGDLEPGILRGRPHRELVHVELADDHGTFLLEPADDRGVVGRDEIAEDLRAAGGADPPGAEHVLDGEGNPGEGAAFPGGDGLVGRRRLLERLIRRDGQEGADPAVDRRDPVQNRPGQLPRGYFFSFQKPVGFLDGQVVELHDAFPFRLLLESLTPEQL